LNFFFIWFVVLIVCQNTPARRREIEIFCGIYHLSSRGLLLLRRRINFEFIEKFRKQFFFLRLNFIKLNARYNVRRKSRRIKTRLIRAMRGRPPDLPFGIKRLIFRDAARTA